VENNALAVKGMLYGWIYYLMNGENNPIRCIKSTNSEENSIWMDLVA
jgi:hypothetical protein